MATLPFGIASVLTRLPSPRADHCLRTDAGATIDLAALGREFGAYQRELRRHVAVVAELPAEDAWPDAMFVEDTVVVLDHAHAVITRPGAASRQGETAAVRAWFVERGVHVYDMQAPAKLDGGDVLRHGDHLLIGVSMRTNNAGAEFLAAQAARHGIRSTIITVPAGLHLKSTLSLVDERTLIYAESAGFGADALAACTAAGLELLPTPEDLGANVLMLGAVVLVSAAAPRTAAMLAARGVAVSAVQAWQFHHGDGALTCPSVRLPAPGCWCT